MVRAWFLILIVLITPPLHAQTRLFVGGAGGVSGGFPPRWNSCEGTSTAQAAALLGIRSGRLAIFADAGVVTGTSGCEVTPVDIPIARVDTSYEITSFEYPVFPVSLNVRFDLATMRATTLTARGGGGLFLGDNVPYFQAGIGSRFSNRSPAFGVELLYTRFNYDRERVINDPENVGPVRSAAARGSADPITLRFLLEL